MKIMADEYFSIGSIVACTTCYQQKIQGEVLAYDIQTKMLAIKSPAASGKQNVHDVKLVNLTYVSDVKVIKEADREVSPQPLPSMNIQKIQARVRQSIEEKKRQINYIGVGVSPEGQKVFNTIVKTISDCKWDRHNIIVMEEVMIKPPYGLEDCVLCRGREDSKALEHVKKIVQKHIKDEQQHQQQKNHDLRKSLSPLPASSTSS